MRPKATAAGFLRGTADGAIVQVDARPMRREACVADGEVDVAREHGVSGEGAEVGGAVCVRHGQILPNRLGIVN